MTSLREEVLQEIQDLTEEEAGKVLRLARLIKYSPGFMAALKSATPPGETLPPDDVLEALETEWAEKEGF